MMRSVSGQNNIVIGGKGVHVRRNGIKSESTVFSQFSASVPGTFGDYCKSLISTDDAFSIDSALSANERYPWDFRKTEYESKHVCGV